MKHTYAIAAAAMGLSALVSSCDDLDQLPHADTTSATVYTSEANYRSVLAKIYSVLSLKGADGGTDITTNKGENFMRCYFNLQECCTDELVFSWMSGDNMTDINYMTWDAQDVWVADTYYWLYYSISLSNEFLRNAQDLSSFSESDQAKIENYKLEARFLRALAYWQVLDLYHKGAMVTENDNVGAYVPNVADAQGLFDYVESELLDIADKMPSRTEQEYGRAPRAAAYMLLSRLYLNAPSYGIAKTYYDEVIKYSQAAINEGYTLHDNFAELFNADNDQRTDEIVFGLESDATTTVSWGASTYIVCGCANSSTSQDPSSVGIASGWSMWRATSQAVGLFSGYTENDVRYSFYTDGQSLEVTDTYDQNQGYVFTKWTNLTDAGEVASNTASYGVNTDFPFFRIAEAYLNISEAILRGGTGAENDALYYLNAIRVRAAGESAKYTDVQLKDIINERGREFQLECQRRTDLIRFGIFTQGGWDCGPKNKDAKYNYYPIPQTELTANPNLSNPEY